MIYFLEYTIILDLVCIYNAKNAEIENDKSRSKKAFSQAKDCISCFDLFGFCTYPIVALLFFKNFFSKKKILLLCFALFCLFVFELHLILQGLNMREGDGILGVGVKSVDIKRNVRGESDRLDHRWRWGTKITLFFHHFIT